MFDPTVFDNLKVVAEGAVYDLDLQGVILITNRCDQVDLAKLSRYFALTFRMADQGIESVHGELRLKAEIADLASEILETQADETMYGCTVEVVFFTSIHHPEDDCPFIQQNLLELWGNRPIITQKLSYFYKHSLPKRWKNTITLNFARKIGEAQADDLQVIVSLMVASIDRLNEVL
ncbi:hypothetical protein [Calidifontibacillus erzurumensis]|uniref:Uncharacterized protein n=1 Tax=Calidifontibacillus erzurumensis TaxID=2741433 RepID=A0A8J8K7R2_9BACI|nr:hypothetical protein [Calidifontibacillus erzurumensis]NSL51021.1 hypothetical protein [Calidifontibacillus erzurumensis]